MRSWQLDSSKPLALILAADARVSPTDHQDDQSWALKLGSADDVGLALQTGYGGRAGLVSLVPFWEYAGHSIYATQDYHTPPAVTAFAPGYLRLTARLLPDVTVTADYWAASSHAVTGRYVLHNTSTASVDIRLDLYAHVAAGGVEQPINVLTLQDATHALYLGKLGNIEPVVLMEGGAAVTGPNGRVRSRVGRDLTLPPGTKTAVRWAHAGLPDMLNSTRRARYWLGVPWATIGKHIERASWAVPDVKTNDAETDAVIAFGYQLAVQSFLRQSSGAWPSLVTTREPNSVYSGRGWQGASPIAAYLLTEPVASIDVALAEGILRNYVATQADDGTITESSGGRSWLMMPILARMTWQVYRVTGNLDLLRAMFPALVAFFERWFREDVDADGDSVPEWQHAAQTGYAGWPLFHGGVDIRSVETPDMLAYLLSEADALRQIAALVDDDTLQETLAPRIAELEAALADMWHADGFAYRDRDTHATPTGAVILDDVPADAEHLPALDLDDPSRLVVEVIGGASHKPTMTVTVSGITPEGESVTEELATGAFTWGYGRGTATTQHIYATVDRVQSAGLSRVYELNVRAVNLAVTDMNTVLPLITGRLDAQQTAAVVEQIKAHLLRPNGLAMFTASGRPGASKSGVWVFWNALICEALLDVGEADLAVDILRRVLRVQAAALKETGCFTTFYQEDTPGGTGSRLDMIGMPMLGVLMRALGVQINAAGRVTIREAFPWGEPVAIRQHGVVVRRDSQKTGVTFPDGTTETVPAGQSATLAPPHPIRPPAPPNLPEPPPLVDRAAPATPVRIPLEIEDDSD